MDVFLFFWKESYTYIMCQNVCKAWQESYFRKFYTSPIVRESLIMRIVISPYKILIFLLRFSLRQGFPHFIKFLLLK